MDSINTAEPTTPNETNNAVPSQPTSLDLSAKQQITSARATKQIIEDFLSSLDRATVNGDYAIKFGIGYQFLQNVLKQTTADIKRMQDEVKA